MTDPSRGFLIHAYNNLEIDYGTMALCASLLIKKNLKNNNVCLVTTNDTISWLNTTHGEEVIDKAFDIIKVIEINRNVNSRTYFDTKYNSKIQPYYNSNRIDTFKLSPYDETILLDADYLVLDKSLDCVWDNHEDILVNKSVRDLNHKTNIGGFDDRFNEMSIPLYWATVVYFKKTPIVESIFDLMSFIKDNYFYYQQLYNFAPSGYFRNDYALSIALHMISGQLENELVKNLPVSDLLVATENDDMINFSDGAAFFVSELQDNSHSLYKAITNVHVMNKWSIGRNASRIIDYAK